MESVLELTRLKDVRSYRYERDGIERHLYIRRREQQLDSPKIDMDNTL